MITDVEFSRSRAVGEKAATEHERRRAREPSTREGIGRAGRPRAMTRAKNDA